MRIENRKSKVKVSAVALIIFFFSLSWIYALPQGANVVNGSVNIDTNGATMSITAPGNTIINWDGYSIGSGELVQYLQSGGTSLNRVTGGSISELLGTLQADGKVWLINPNGILIGNGAVIDTAGFMGSTLDITNENFLSGNYIFEGTPVDAEIINYGSILTNGGDVHLFAPTIKNEGTIKATNGDVNMVSAEKLILAVDGGISVEVPATTTNEGIVNKGTIEGVNVNLRASGSHYSLAINTEGVIRANDVVTSGGRVFLKADDGAIINTGVVEAMTLGDNGGAIEVSANFVSAGTLRADGINGGSIAVTTGMLSLADAVTAIGTAGDGGAITLNVSGKTLETGTSLVDASGAVNGGTIRHTAGQQITTSGTYRAVGTSGEGGWVDLTGWSLKMLSAQIDVAGATKGGTVRLGGEYQGGKPFDVDEIPNAQVLAITEGTIVRADATNTVGDGGRIIVWSDQRSAVLGGFYARPGSEGGDGGFVEISSGDTLTYGGYVETGGGTVLFDPKNITIANAGSATDIQYAMILGFNYTPTYSVNQDLDGSDCFGFSVSLDGLQMAVGAYQGDGSGNAVGNSGEVYLYTFTDTSFGGGKLIAMVGDGYTGGNNIDQDLDGSDYFGIGVSLDNNRLAVGAPCGDGSGNSVGASGEVYLYTFTDSTFGGGTLAAIVGDGYTTGNNIDQDLDGSDGFGGSVSIDGNRLVVGASVVITGVGNFHGDGSGNSVGASGEVYLYTFTDSDFTGGALAGIIGDGYTGGNNINQDLDSNDFFGTGVSLEGNRLAVGGYGADGYNNSGGEGEVFLYTFTGSDFTGGALAGVIGDGYTSGNNINQDLDGSDYFGQSVSLNGNRLAVGTYQGDGYNNSNGNSGEVYLYTFTGSDFSGGTLVGMIGDGYAGGDDINQDLDGSDYFGSGVALDDNRLVVGAYYGDGYNNSNGTSGDVYFYAFTDSSFGGGGLVGMMGEGYSSYEANMNQGLDGSDQFGRAVALDGLQMAVGAFYGDGYDNAVGNSGEVYLYTFTDTSFGGGKLMAMVGDGYTGGNNINQDLDGSDYFGLSVALDNNRLAVGSPWADGSGNSVGSSGEVHLYTFTDSSFGGGTLAAVIGDGYTGGNNINQDLDGSDAFGGSVSIDGNRLVVGAAAWVNTVAQIGGDGSGNSVGDSGEVYLYTFTGSDFSGGSLAGMIGDGYTGGNNINQDLDGSDYFGFSVSLDNNQLAVGSWWGDGYSNGTGASGEVYLYAFTDSDFSGGSLAGVIGDGYTGGNNINQDLDGSDQFGFSVSLDNNRLAVGARWGAGYNNSTGGSGEVYLYTFTDSDFSGGSLAGVIGDGYMGGNNINQDLDGSDSFGSAVAVDGNRLVVGAYDGDGYSNSQGGSGEIYLYTFTDSSFGGGGLAGIIGNNYSPAAVQQRLDTGDMFGASVSLDGMMMAVGARYGDGLNNGVSGAGEVYLYTFTDTSFGGLRLMGMIGDGYTGGNNINQDLDLNDEFANSLSLDSNRLAVGSTYDDGSGASGSNNYGAVYLYTFTDSYFGGGALAGVIGEGYSTGNSIDQNLDTGDIFGHGLSLDGNRLAVGSWSGDGSSNAVSGSGEVYLYTFTDSDFSGGALAGIIGDGYTGGNNINQDLDVDDRFGGSLSLDGNRLAVGTPSDDGSGASGTNNYGAVYLYTFTDTDFSGGALAGIIGENYTTGNNIDQTLDGTDYFGSVALKDNTLVVGASGDDGADGNTSGAGAVYVYTFTGTDFSGGALSTIIGDNYFSGMNQNLDNDDSFGRSVAFNDGQLAIGAWKDDGPNASGSNDYGAVYLYIIPSGTADNVTDAVFSTSAASDITLTPDSITALLNTPQSVILQANNDITVDSAITANNASGDAGNLTMQAGRSILINANITTDNGDLYLYANETVANGVVDANRDAGDAEITMAASTTIDAGTGNITMVIRNSADKTNNESGDITLYTLTTTGDILIENLGPSAGGITTNAAIGSANDITLTADSMALGGNITGSGTLVIQPNTTTTTIGLGGGAGTLNLDDAELDYLQDGFSMLTFGRSDLTGTITADAYTFSDNVTLLGGTNSIAITGAVATGLSNLIINTTGSSTQSAAITGTGLSLLGAGGAHTLTNTSNNFVTIAGNTGSISYVDTDALTVGVASGTTGITTTGAVTLRSDTGTITTAQVISSGSDVTLTADGMALGANISGSGTLTIQPDTTTTTMGFGDSATGTLNLTDTELGYIQDGFTQIYFGRTDSEGDVDIHGNALGGVLSDPLTIRTSGSAGDVVFDTSANNITWADATMFEVIAGRTITMNSGSLIDSTSTGFSGAERAVYMKANVGGAATGDDTDAIIITGATIQSSTGNIELVGQGKGDSAANNYGILIWGGSDIISNGTGADAATITLTGTGGTGTGGDYGVIILNSGTTVTSIDGDVSITGQGGAGSGASNVGVYLYDGGEVISTGTTSNAASITMVGTGGGGTGYNYGFYMDGNAGASTYVQSAMGDVSITGQGGAGATGSDNYGIYLYNEGFIQSTGTGADAATITLVGTGGGGTDRNRGIYINATGSEITSIDGAISLTGQGGTAATGLGGVGILMHTGVLIESTGTGTDAATITLVGTGGAGTRGAHGIDIRESDSQITSINGDISITGQAGDVSELSLGILMYNNAKIISTGTTADAATITLIGTGSNGSSDGNEGIQINGNTGSETYITSAMGDISVTGQGGVSATGASNYGIDLTAGGQITSTGTGADAATITLVGTGGNGTTANYGVYIYGTDSKVESIDGAISVTGQGGDGSGTTNYGVYVYDGGQIISTGTTSNAATVNLLGTGGNGTDNNQGIYVDGNSGVDTYISSAYGNISLTGQGGVSATGEKNQGIKLKNGGNIVSIGTGADAATITLVGTGGGGTDSNRGIGLYTASITSVDGDISLTGQGGTGTGAFNYGITLEISSDVTSNGTSANAANITMVGTAGASGTTNNNTGVTLATSSVVDTTNGDVSVTGVGGGSSDDYNYGVRLYDTGSFTSNGAGNITLTGTAGVGSNSSGIKADIGTNTIGGASDTGDITLSADTMDLSSLSVQSSGDLYVQPTTTTTTIGLGSSATGTLNLTDTELGYFQPGFANAYFGRSDSSGDIDIHDEALDTLLDGGTNVTVRTPGSGGDITLDATMNAFTWSAATQFELIAGRTITVNSGVSITSTSTAFSGAERAIYFKANVGGASTGDSTTAIYVTNAILRSSTGDIELVGQAMGDGSGNNYGIYLYNGGQVISDGTGADAAKITLVGSAGNGSDTCIGIRVRGTNSRVSSIDGDISLTGQGATIAAAGNVGVDLFNGGQVISTGTTTNAATITITGTGGDGTNSNTGISVADSGSANTYVTSNMGDIVLTGKGGDGSGVYNYGVAISGGAKVESAGTGSDAATITLNGTGGDGTNENFGIFTTDTDSRIVSIDGNIQLLGQGGDGSGTSNHGIYIRNDSYIQSTGTSSDAASITMVGTGGAGTDTNYGVYLNGNGGTDTYITTDQGNLAVTGQGGGTGATNIGVYLYNGGKIESTGVGASAGTVTLTGTGVAGTSSNVGVQLNSSAEISSADGAITVNGQGGNGSAQNNQGILLLGSSLIESVGTGTNAATITLNGTGGTGGTSGNIAIYHQGSSSITSIDGDIQLTGQAGSGSSNSHQGVVIASAAQVVSTGTSADAADVTLTGTGGDAGTGANYGVAVTSANSKVGVTNGNLSLTGIGGSSGINNRGVYLYDGGEIASEGSGNIVVTGTGGNGGTQSVYAWASTNDNLIGGASNTGTITITGANDDVYLASTRVQTTNTVDITSDATDVNLTSAMVTGSDVTVDASTGTGAITVGAIEATTGDVTLTAGTGGIGEGSLAGIITSSDLFITSGGNVDLSTGNHMATNVGFTSVTGSASFRNIGDTILRTSSVSSDLTLTTLGGDISAQGAEVLTVGGTSTFNAAGKTVTLNGANHLITAIAFTAEDAIATVNGALDIAASTIGDDLTITAAGNMTDSGNIVVGGDLSFTSAGNDVTLNSAGNRFGTLSLSAGSASITEADSTMLHNITITDNDANENTGEFNVYSGGNITDSTTGTMAVTDTAILVSGGNATNVSGDTAGTQDIILNDGNFSANRTRVYAYNMIYIGGDITFGDSEIGNDLTVISSGDITDASTIRIGRDLWMEAEKIFLDGTWIIGRNKTLISRGVLYFPNYDYREAMIQQLLQTPEMDYQVQSAKLETQDIFSESSSYDFEAVISEELAPSDGAIQVDYNPEPKKKRKRVIK